MMSKLCITVREIFHVLCVGYGWIGIGRFWGSGPFGSNCIIVRNWPAEDYICLKCTLFIRTTTFHIDLSIRNHV